MDMNIRYRFLVVGLLISQLAADCFPNELERLVELVSEHAIEAMRVSQLGC
jgi:hypothetical protein